MDIVFVSSEVVPFAKTGGLADVSGALPRALHDLGHRVSVFVPAYRGAKENAPVWNPLKIRLNIPVGAKTVEGGVIGSRLPESNLDVYLIDQKDYFDRDHLYGRGSDDYADNCERFVFFCRSVLEAVRQLQIRPHILHCNDWQTGLIPAYIETEYRQSSDFENAAVLMTIHNLAYQGRFWHWDMLLTGLDWKHFNWREVEFHGQLNLLKAGIVFADTVSTVSPTYAQEIQTPEFGYGLEQVLQHRRDSLAGILNGIDPNIWSPQADPHIARTFGRADWQEGKRACKRALQGDLGLDADEEVPVIGLVGRLAEQKGWSLILPVIERWLGEEHVQFVVLGDGDESYRRALIELAKRFSQKLAVKIGFSEPLAHQIEAGADMFLMPSRYEPCGLNQMYSLAYGTLPIVRATGGLADTVVDATEAAVANRTANGFSFNRFHQDGLEQAMQRAVHMYRRNRSLWGQLVETGMKQDWSWQRSAQQYQKLYEQMTQRSKVPAAQN